MISSILSIRIINKKEKDGFYQFYLDQVHNLNILSPHWMHFRSEQLNLSETRP